ncbi:hypothetical protein FRB91_011435 [Serendipita sp. 411]|nr:hypothetical protein FRB91_011435 [Serendipita sp. 411]
MSSLTRVAASRSTPYLPSYQLSRKRSTSPPPQVVLPSKSVTSLVATAQSSEFYYDSKSNRIETHLALSLPAKASPNQWPIGESLRTALATLRFELHAKLCVSAAAGPVEISLQPLEVQLSPVSQEQRSVVVGKVARKRAARSKSAAGSRKVSPTPSTSGSSKGDPETPPPVPTPPSSVELSSPESAAYTFTRHTGPTADDVHQSRGRSSSKRRTHLVDMPQSSRKSMQPSVVGQAVAFTSDDVAFGAALSGSLKRMPSHAVRDWEAELERITSSSKLKTDAMRGKSATDHGHGDNSRASRALRMRRCTIATQPPPVGTFQTSYPPKVSVAQ